jgi:hypothetical protein
MKRSSYFIVCATLLLIVRSSFGGELQDGRDSAKQSGIARLAASSPLTGEQMPWQLIASGGGFTYSAQLRAFSAAGQSSVGSGSSPGYQLSSGFVRHYVHTATGGCCTGIRGDANGDGNDADIVDLTFIAEFLFSGGPAPVCDPEGDVNGDDAIADIVDLTFVADFLFGGGPTPAACP